MSKTIITIGREFGSGGRTIGKEVAARLGIECYDDNPNPQNSNIKSIVL